MDQLSWRNSPARGTAAVANPLGRLGTLGLGGVVNRRECGLRGAAAYNWSRACQSNSSRCLRDASRIIQACSAAVV
jgi:hypothetical protein